jgi:hypothetical protein
MPSSWITKSDANEIRLAHPVNRTGMAAGDRDRSYDLLTDPLFQDVDKTKTALVLKELLQEDLTVRIRLRDLPDGDEAKATDPGREDFFWEGRGVSKELVSRSTIVESCVWLVDHYHFTLRVAR